MKLRSIFFVILLIVTVFALGLFFTNPDETAHKDFLKEKMISISDRKIEEELNKPGRSENKGLKLLAHNFGALLSDKLSDQLIEARAKRVNYYFFSVSKVQYGGQWYPIAIGIADHMYFFPKVEGKLDDLDTSDLYKLFKY